MAVGIFIDGQVHHKRKLLHTDQYLCIFNNDILRLASPLRLEDYLDAAHVVVTGSGARDVIGEELAKTNGKRQVSLETPHLLSVPFIVRRNSCDRHDSRQPGEAFRRYARFANITAAVEPPDGFRFRFCGTRPMMPTKGIGGCETS